MNSTVPASPQTAKMKFLLQRTRRHAFPDIEREQTTATVIDVTEMFRQQMNQRPAKVYRR